MMLGEQQPLASNLKSPSSSRSSSVSRFFWNSFSRSHTGMALRKDAKPLRREREIGFEQPFELQERLFVEDDVIDVLEADAALLADNMRRRGAESPDRASCG